MTRHSQTALFIIVLVACFPGVCGLAAEALTTASVGWESLVVWAIAAAIAALQWDRKLRQPGGYEPVFVAILAVAALGVGLFLPAWNMFAVGAVLGLMVLGCGLARRSDQTSLAGYAAVALPAALATSSVVGTWLDALVTQWATQTAGDLLHLANIAHITRGDVIDTAAEQFHIAYRMQSWMSWPVLAAVALLYSAILGRNWLHSLLNAAMAAPLTAAFHSGAIAMVSASEVWQWQWLPTAAWPWISALATVIALLSADRAFEMLFKQIEPNENASRANPLVHAWNTFVRRQKLGRIEITQAMRIALWVAAAGLLIFGCISIPRAVNQVLASTNVSRKWTAPDEITVALGGGAFDVKHLAVDRRLKREWGEVSDVWIATAPDALLELVVTQYSDQRPTPDILMGSVWSIDPLPSKMSGDDLAAVNDTTLTETDPSEAAASEAERSGAAPAESPMADVENDPLADLAPGIEAKYLYSTAASGHALLLSCELDSAGGVLEKPTEESAFSIRLTRRSAAKTNSRQAEELAAQFQNMLGKIQASIGSDAVTE